MPSAEELLEGATKDGSLDINEWPRVLETVLSRLDYIVYNEFPKPTTPPSTSTDALAPRALPSRPDTVTESSQEPHSADKENAPPSAPSASPIRPPVPSFSQATSQTETESQPSPQIPQELQEVYTSIKNALTKSFAQSPPYTVQRLSELVLRPKAHYRFLPSYLRALDRVVSVSSSSAMFPLPAAAVVGGTGPLSNGTTMNNAAPLGSDESLGGALLTPIPWLRGERDRSAGSNGPNNQSELVSESTEMVDGPNGAGRIETVSVINGVLGTASPRATSPTSTTSTSETLREAGAVTQGELLRQEQQAGVVPIGQSSPRRTILPSPSASATASAGPLADSSIRPTTESDNKDNIEQAPEEHPHARGPEEIGMEDMGPQERALGGAINIEAAVGRAAPGRQTEQEHKHNGEDEQMGDAGSTAGAAADAAKEAEKKDKDVVLADPDGKTDEDVKMGETAGDEGVPDASSR